MVFVMHAFTTSLNCEFGLSIKLRTNVIVIIEAETMHTNKVTNGKTFSNVHSCTIYDVRLVSVIAELLPWIACSQASPRQLNENASSELFRVKCASFFIQIEKCNFSACIDMSTRCCLTQFFKRRHPVSCDTDDMIQALFQKHRSLHRSESTCSSRLAHYMSVLHINPDLRYLQNMASVILRRDHEHIDWPVERKLGAFYTYKQHRTSNEPSSEHAARQSLQKSSVQFRGLR